MCVCVNVPERLSVWVYNAKQDVDPQITSDALICMKIRGTAKDCDPQELQI